VGSFEVFSDDQILMKNAIIEQPLQKKKLSVCFVCIRCVPLFPVKTEVFRMFQINNIPKSDWNKYTSLNRILYLRA
jgi:hypothetical protein